MVHLPIYFSESTSGSLHMSKADLIPLSEFLIFFLYYITFKILLFFLIHMMNTLRDSRQSVDRKLQRLQKHKKLIARTW